MREMDRKAGLAADLLLLDRARYRPRATYIEPRQLSEGVRTLVVNGRLAIDEYKLTGTAAGRALLRTPPKGTCPPISGTLY
jgi:N-acyl-D-aspartate/D-glutamate deacylase